MELDKIIGNCCNIIKDYSFCSNYQSLFTVLPAKTAALKKKAYELRYEVFNKENDFFEITEGCHRLEEDVYDKKAYHALLVHNSSGIAVGAVRVNFFNPEQPSESFFLQSLCDHPYLHRYSGLDSVCEISKMCMVKEFRRREGDGSVLPAFYDQDLLPDKLFQRKIPYAPLGLISFALEEAIKKQCLNCVTLFETNQLQGLKSIGFYYKVLGPQLSFMGRQQPIIINIKQTLDNMFFKNRACWEVITNHGQLHELANQIDQVKWEESVFDEKCINKIITHLS